MRSAVNFWNPYHTALSQPDHQRKKNPNNEFDFCMTLTAASLKKSLSLREK